VSVFVVIGLIGWIAGYWQSYLSSWVGERVLLDLRRQLFRHMMRLELGHHERTPTGRSVSRLTSDIQAINQLVVEGATSLVINGLSLIGVIIILTVYDWKLAIAAFAIFPVLALGTWWFRVRATAAYRLEAALSAVGEALDLAAGLS
jgi:ATP-binding cassette subfamily B protein